MTKVVLGGGLGNQLFQYAAGLKIAQGEKLILDNSYGLARNGKDNQLDIEEFELPNYVSILRQVRTPRVILKFVKFSFRESAKEKSRIIVMLEGIATFVNTFNGENSRKYFINKGIGLDRRIGRVKSPFTLIGYFQTADIPESLVVKKVLFDLKLKKYSPELSLRIDEAKKFRPIFVHVRLTDYKTESRFGIPSEKYYEDALVSLDASGNPQSKIWLFSDSPEEAKCLIPERFHSRLLMCPDSGLSSAESLELMRYGGAYVIANSTFSWWAAFLRKNQETPVIAPNPWFSGMPDPVQICPSTWLRILTF